MDRRSENVGRRPKIIMKSTGWTAPTEPFASAYVNYISCLQTLRFVAKTSGHLFVRKNYNAPHPPGKTWSTIDRALQNFSQLFGAKHIAKTQTISSRAENSSFRFLDGKCLSTKTWGGSHSAPDLRHPERGRHSTARNARINVFVSFCRVQS